VTFRDQVRRILPVWLQDRIQNGLTVGYRLMWALAWLLDAAMELFVQGSQARFPGVGTPTALPYLARDRKITRSPADTDESFAVRLKTWRQQWGTAGDMLSIARRVQEYLPTHPRVRVVSRAGHWLTLETDGSYTRTTAAWDWDSVSNPSRSGHWWNIWVIVYGPTYADAGVWGTADGQLWGEPFGFGLEIPEDQSSALRTILHEWKSAHTTIRAVIFTDDATDFDPDDLGGTLHPDGTWGEWAKNVAGSYVDARPSQLRFMEPY